ncbi:MAG: DUF4965 domain-containing protein, partial [Planctomycetia bacterium]|nr:DUF4965 domain-containing protein [Planctomycetia bacterium]
ISTLRAPAVPLITCDPYFSVWSFGDNLTDSWPRHWTGAVNAITLMARIDGKTWRLCGMEPGNVPALPLQNCSLSATASTYTYQLDGVRIRLVFRTPVLIDDPELVGRPASYLTWTVDAVDGASHEIAIFYDSTGEFVVNEPDQAIMWETPVIDGLTVRTMKSADQNVLGRSGDNLRIEWGTFYVATPSEEGTQMKVLSARLARETFAKTGAIDEPEDGNKPRAAGDEWPVIACVWNPGTLRPGEIATRYLVLAYDDEYSIRYLGTNLRPWWRRNGMTGPEMVKLASEEYGELVARADEFDLLLAKQTTEAGGDRYRSICIIAYRQAIASHKLCAGPNGEMMLFGKECFSNGCIGTVDILYPASPVFAHFNNDLLRATVTPVFEYVKSGRWNFPFAPHDIGQYPLAEGQVYGGGEKTDENQMPVEESGNMLIVAGMIARNDGNVDYLKPYMKTIDTWAEYLREKGLDPEHQLCTDDFAGHLAHNANLSVKAIVALGVYAEICRMDGRTDRADEYARLAKQWAGRWKEMAIDGDHCKLAFDKPGTWSQKYNLVWDRIFQLGLFDPEIAETEVAYYRTKLNRYGLPLDNRSLYTKTDWEVWTASLTGDREDFDTLVEPIGRFLNDTPDRVPFSDWYWTDSAKMRGFQHRPVIGGVFIRLMEVKPIRGVDSVSETEF